MNEKRSFRRNDAESAPGILVIGDRRIRVEFDNISLVGARVKAAGEKLPATASTAKLTLNDDDCKIYVRCKVVGLDEGDFYRLKFDGIGEGSLNNLLTLLRKLSGGTYHPEDELPNLVLDLTS